MSKTVARRGPGRPGLGGPGRNGGGHATHGRTGKPIGRPPAEAPVWHRATGNPKGRPQGAGKGGKGKGAWHGGKGKGTWRCNRQPPNPGKQHGGACHRQPIPTPAAKEPEAEAPEADGDAIMSNAGISEDPAGGLGRGAPQPEMLLQDAMAVDGGDEASPAAELVLSIEPRDASAFWRQAAARWPALAAGGARPAASPPAETRKSPDVAPAQAVEAEPTGNEGGLREALPSCVEAEPTGDEGDLREALPSCAEATATSSTDGDAIMSTAGAFTTSASDAEVAAARPPAPVARPPPSGKCSGSAPDSKGTAAAGVGDFAPRSPSAYPVEGREASPRDWGVSAPTVGPGHCYESKPRVELTPQTMLPEDIHNTEVESADSTSTDGSSDEEELRQDKVLEVLATLPGWAGCSAPKVDNVSAKGTAAVYKVHHPDATPPTVAVHLWGEDADPTAVARTAAAAAVFAEADLAPRRLDQGEGWFVEPWVEGGKPDFGADGLRALGDLVARAHSLPQEWYGGFRTTLKEGFPALHKAPHEHHVWPWWSREAGLLGSLREDCQQAFLGGAYAFLRPTSFAAFRAVTCHGDCHGDNVLQTAGGLRLIDFEWACVAHAAHDLAFVVRTCCKGKLALAKKRLFIEAYLCAAGMACGEEEVEATLLDAEIYVLATHCQSPPLELWRAKDNPDRWLSTLKAYGDLVRSARASVALRQRVLELGAVAYLGELQDSCVPGAPALLCDAGQGRALPQTRLVVNGDGTVSPEVRRDLVLGESADGSVCLVPFEAATGRLVFQVAGGKLFLSEGKGLCAAPRRPVAGRFIEALRLGRPGQGAVVLEQDGPFLLRHRRDLGAQVLRVGDPQVELDTRWAKELCSCGEKGDAKKVAALAAAGASMSLRHDGESAAHVAAREGHLAVLEALLAHGLDVNITSKHGGTPLIEAAQYGRADCVRRLLEAPGVNIEAKEDERTALEWARDPDPEHEEACEGHREAAELLEAAQEKLRRQAEAAARRAEEAQRQADEARRAKEAQDLSQPQRAGQLVGGLVVLLGNAESDMPHLQSIQKELKPYGIHSETRICSGQEPPAGLEVIIAELNKSAQPVLIVACAGGSDALSGIASLSRHPVVSCPPDGLSNTSCLTGPVGRSNGSIMRPADVAKYAAQFLSSSCPAVAAAVEAASIHMMQRLPPRLAVASPQGGPRSLLFQRGGPWQAALPVAPAATSRPVTPSHLRVAPGKAPQLRALQQAGVPGGYVMVQPGMQGMMMMRPMMPGAGQDCQGQNMGLPPMMVQPGMGMSPNMQMMAGPQPGGPQRHGGGQAPGLTPGGSSAAPAAPAAPPAPARMPPQMMRSSFFGVMATRAQQQAPGLTPGGGSAAPAAPPAPARMPPQLLPSPMGTGSAPPPPPQQATAGFLRATRLAAKRVARASSFAPRKRAKTVSSSCSSGSSSSSSSSDDSSD